MYIYNPKKETKAHIVIPIVLILIGMIAVLAAGIGPVPIAVMQAIGFVCLAIAIHLISRYSLTDHTYEADSEKRVLNVRKLMGKKITLVAAIEYDDIISVDKKDKEYSLKEKYKKTYKVHNFCNNIFPASEYCIVCDIDGQDIAVIIEADKTLADILERR